MVAAVATVFALRGLAFTDFVPIWDGRIYADCFVQAGQHLSLGALNCAGHPTAGYALLLGLSQVVAPASYPAMLVVNLALGVLALLAFHGVLRILDRDPGHAAPRLAATAALSTHPLLLASAVNVTPDYGVAVFFVLTLWAAAARRVWLAALLGTGLSLSKEPGIGLYGLLLLASVVAGPQAATWRERLRWLIRPPLALPFAAIGLFLAMRLHSGALWGGQTPGSVGGAILTPAFDEAQRYFLVWIFVTGFQWVGSALVVADATRMAWRARRAVLPRETAFAATLLLGGAYGLTRFVTFCNARYFLPLAPLLVLAVYLAAVRFLWKRPWPTAFLSVWTALLFVSSVRTADPVMRWIYGTFRFGSREMLLTTSRTGECCGFGRDQLVYNLEFVKFHQLQNAAYAALRPGDGTVLVAHPLADWYFAGTLSPHFRRTLGAGKPLRLLAPRAVLALADPPSRIFYMAFPNFRNLPQVQELKLRYQVRRVLVYEVDGYKLDVVEMTLRGSAAAH